MSRIKIRWYDILLIPLWSASLVCLPLHIINENGSGTFYSFVGIFGLSGHYIMRYFFPDQFESKSKQKNGS